MINAIAAFSQDMRLRYMMLLQSLTGILATTLEGDAPDSLGARLLMTNQANAASAFFLSRSYQSLSIIADAIVQMAAADAGMQGSTKLTLEHIVELRNNADLVLEELSLRLKAITIANTGIVINELRRVKLTAGMLQSAGASRFTALMKARMGRVGDLKFVTPDALGRKWRSSDYISSMVGKELTQLYVESFLYCAALDGDTEAKVVYPNPEHVNNGLVFAITGDDWPSFDTIRDDIWHPNSTAGVERVHS